jgi:photosystem II stability/assembly factor-like uncharacterized protein
MTARTSFLLLLSLIVVVQPARADEDAPKGGPPEFKRLKFRLVGPAAGGRVARACGVQGDPLVYYAATAAGGVWKSTDGGIHWKPMFDDQPIATIGSIAVAPSDPNVVYVGSGEANIRGNVQPGNGIYKSTDAGKTWKHVWQQPGQIGTMIVHPTNPDVAYAAVLGHAFGPNEERGVFRTTDGGKTWKRVLYVSQDAGASDVCFDPSNPHVLFAGTWQTRRLPWELTSGGPGSGLYVSRDSGDTWTRLVPPPAPDSPEAGRDAPEGKKYAEGLPEGIWGKVCLAVAPSDGRRVYAMIEAEKGGLFRSDDGGSTWKNVNASRAIRQRAWYFSTITVHPANPDVIFFPQVPLLKSIDGGKTLQRVKGPHHGDHHDIWIDPKDPKRIIDSNDGGVDISTNGGETWYAPPLPIGQFYHIGVDNRVPYHVMGTMQDLGTASGPSNSLYTGGINLSDWHNIGGGETGFTVPDPSDPNIVYAGEYGGYISRYDHRTRQARNLSIYPFNPSGHDPADLRYRFQWTAPIMVSPHDPKTLYHAANVLFRSTDAGETWKPVGGDLTRNDKSKQKWSGGPITGDNTGVEVYGTIFAVAESPVALGRGQETPPQRGGLLWAGSDDGLVHVSRDAGQKWTNVTPTKDGWPEWATVLCIEPSRFDAETAWVVVDNHRQDDNRPYLFKTTDAGATWKPQAGSTPEFLRVVREDPKKKGLLYLGTERGLLISRDGGDSWTALKLNFPTAAVTDLFVKDNDLVIGTNGRSIWILDDLTPIRDWSAEVAAKDVHLFPVQPALRWRYHGSFEEGTRRGAGQNPPAGAVVHYYLKAKPKGELILEVLDNQGKLVAKQTSKEEPPEPPDEGAYTEEEKKKPLPTEPGLHRVVWDLRYQGAQAIKGARVDSGDPKVGPLAIPGDYVVRLAVDGKTLTAPLQILPDPRAGSSEALAKQQEFTLKVRDDITRLAKTVEQIRLVKKQVLTRADLLKDDARAKPLLDAGKEAVKKMDELEEKLHNPKAKVAYDILALKGGAKLYSQLVFLFEALKEADGPPNQGVREVYEEQSLLLKKYDLEWQVLLAGDLAKLNDQAKALDLPGLILPVVSKEK